MQMQVGLRVEPHRPCFVTQNTHIMHVFDKEARGSMIAFAFAFAFALLRSPICLQNGELTPTSKGLNKR